MQDWCQLCRHVAFIRVIMYTCLASHFWAIILDFNENIGIPELREKQTVREKGRAVWRKYESAVWGKISSHVDSSRLPAVLWRAV